jgi:serine/threonine protein phosphatase 1
VKILLSISATLETLIEVIPGEHYDIHVKDIRLSSDDEATRIEQAVTKDGYYLGDKKMADFLTIEKGLTQLQPANKYDNVCSIGFCEKTQQWVGFSHRAIYGFCPGSKVKPGDCAYKPKKLKEDIIRSYMDFWSDPSTIIEVEGENILRWVPDYKKLRAKYGPGFYHEWADSDWVKTFGRQSISTTWKMLKDQGYMICETTPIESIPTGRGEWTAKTTEDARQMAIDFAESVASVAETIEDGAMESTSLDLNSIWVTSDIHGCFKTFKKLYSKINPSKLYVLGDLVDRGPMTKEVLDFCMANKAKIICLKGNHEDLMLKALVDKKKEKLWLSRGGKEVLKSFKVKMLSEIPQEYLRFIKSLRIYKTVGDYVLSHAGLNLNSEKDPFKLTKTNEAFILWNRSIKEPPEGGLTLVVGHTPKPLNVLKKTVKTALVRVDGGCVYGGNLIAFCLGTKELKNFKSVDKL